MTDAEWPANMREVRACERVRQRQELAPQVIQKLVEVMAVRAVGRVVEPVEPRGADAAQDPVGHALFQTVARTLEGSRELAQMPDDGLDLEHHAARIGLVREDQV